MKLLISLSLLFPLSSGLLIPDNVDAQRFRDFFHRRHQIVTQCQQIQCQQIQCQQIQCQQIEYQEAVAPYGYKTEIVTRNVTRYQTEQRTRRYRDQFGNIREETYNVQVPVSETVTEEVQVAKTQADVLNATDATVSQLGRDVRAIQDKLRLIQKDEVDPTTLQKLEELINELKKDNGDSGD